MIDEKELLRLIDEQRATIMAETGEGDEYRTGCIAALQWVREEIERVEAVAGKHVTRETHTRAQIADHCPGYCGGGDWPQPMGNRE